MKNRFYFPLVFVILLLLTACGGKEAASAMSLQKTEGSVEVLDGDKKELTPEDGMRLYHGYQVATREVSYAWINLDQVKLTKMDMDSEVEILKDGNNLELVVNQGALFFNIEEALSEDETLNIRTSSMMIGIRGTCGWVVAEDESHMKVYILEGTVECTKDETSAPVSVSAGMMAEISTESGSGEVSVREFTEGEIPEFVQVEFEGNDTLNDRVVKACNMDIVTWRKSQITVTMPVTAEELQELFNRPDVKTVRVLAGDGDNVLRVTGYLYLGSQEGAGLYLDDGISVVIEGEEEEPGSLVVWEGRTLQVKGDIFVGKERGMFNNGTVLVEGSIEVYGSLENQNSFTVTGGIHVMPPWLVEEYEDGSQWGVPSLINGGYLYTGQGILNEGSVRIENGSEIVGGLNTVGEGYVEN